MARHFFSIFVIRMGKRWLHYTICPFLKRTDLSVLSVPHSYSLGLAAAELSEVLCRFLYEVGETLLHYDPYNAL